MVLGFPSLFLSSQSDWEQTTNMSILGIYIDTAISKPPVLLSPALAGKSQASNTGRIEDSCSVGG